MNLDGTHHGRMLPALAREGVYQPIDAMFRVRLGSAHLEGVIESRIDCGEVESTVNPLLQ